MKTAKNSAPKGIKLEWDMKSLFYKSITDPQIEKDVVAMEKKFEAFAKKYSGRKDYVEDLNKLAVAIKDWEDLLHHTSGKPLRYLHLLLELESGNTKAQSLLNKYADRLTKASNQVVFFELALGKIDLKTQKEILKSPLFKDYKYFFEKTFKNAKYNLSESEEKILSLKSGPSHRMWVDAQSKYLNSQVIKFKGENLPIAKAIDMRSSLPLKDRHALHKILIQKCKEVSFFAESELVSIVTNKKINDELRGFSSPEQATILRYENDVESVNALVAATTKYFTLSKKFYSLKAKVLKMKKMSVADTSVPVGKASEQKVPFEKSVTLIRESFSKAGNEFVEIFNEMLSNGKIDVYPKMGKRGGAFCSSNHNEPTVILLNHVDNMRSVETLAHEMGHAIHGELSKSQPILKEDYTISVAEVASTFFENILFDHVFPTLSEKEKFNALFSKVGDDMTTIFRQIAFFNFEKDLHKTIRDKGGMSKEEIAALFTKHLSSYLGSAVEVTADDGYSFVYVPHFRTFFYVYSYAYGQLVSKALYEKYKEDKGFINQVKKFLSAGGSMSPEDIFKSIGIDTSKPEFFEKGLKSIDADIKELEKLAKQAKLI